MKTVTFPSAARGLAGLAVVLLAVGVTVRAEVVVHSMADLSNPLLPGINMYSASAIAKVLTLDLNSDGTDDFRFETQVQHGFDVFPLGRNAVLAYKVDPLTSYAEAMPPGTLLGPESYPTGLSWDQTVNIPGGFRLGININGCYQRQCVGQFINTDACMGVRFDVNGELHYGWVRISQSSFDFAEGFPGGYIREIGFETRPNTPVIIVPEPSLAAFAGLALAALLLVLRRRRPAV